jgi:predicted nucleic acid-binding protein
MSPLRSPARPALLDTAYVLARLNTRDQWHPAAVAWERRLAASRQALVTTEFILAEIADGLATIRFRTQAVRAIDAVRASSLVEVVPATSTLFTAALDLYRARPDKDWGLTDCASFVVMQEHGLTDALTTDEHFRQAGFRALLLEALE